ncbi:hypothetical protein LguiA_003810 [Lonicera macranthoides]
MSTWGKKKDNEPFTPPVMNPATSAMNSMDSQVERLKSQIFILSCTQRRAASESGSIHEWLDLGSFKALFKLNPCIFCEFDWELDELEEFTDKLIEEEELTEDQKDAFKDFVKEKVREGKKANREAREARRKALAEMSEETKAAFEKMRFYKFYPVPSPDTPDVSSVKVLWKGTQSSVIGTPTMNDPMLCGERLTIILKGLKFGV